MCGSVSELRCRKNPITIEFLSKVNILSSLKKKDSGILFLQQLQRTQRQTLL